MTIVNKLKKIYKENPSGLNNIILYKYDILNIMNLREANEFQEKIRSGLERFCNRRDDKTIYTKPSGRENMFHEIMLEYKRGKNPTIKNDEREIELEGRKMKCDGENGQVLAKFKTTFEKEGSATDGEGVIEINVKPGSSKPFIEIAWLPRKKSYMLHDKGFPITVMDDLLRLHGIELGFGKRCILSGKNKAFCTGETSIRI